MMIETPFLVEYAHSCSATDSPSALFCWVKFNHLKREQPFIASENDVELHGRELYARLQAGHFGKIHEGGTFSICAPPVISQREISLTRDTQFFLDQALVEANLENSRGTARGIVLVWSALLEIALSEVIRSRLPAEVVKSNLGAKIATLKSKGLLPDAEDYDDLIAIKEIRNHAAHSLHFSSFEHLRGHEAAFKAYQRLYNGYAEAMYHEVAELAFVARFVFSPACLGSIERLLRLKSG